MSAGIRERTRERCLNRLRAAIPEAMALMEGPAGELSLAEYARAMPGGSAPGGGAALQDGEDLIALAEREAARLFSPATGAALRRELENRFLVLTANHHGVDFHPEFLQGDLVFALGCRDAVPLFAYGGVPCDNMAFPRGILLAPRTTDTTRPFHVPLLSNADRRALVSARGPYDPNQVKNALAALPRFSLSPGEQRAAERLITRVYLNPLVLGQISFKDQMSVANALMWRELAATGFRLPPLASLDLLQLAKELVIQDLKQPGSLVHDLLLERELTEAAFHALNHARGCWTIRENRLERGSFLFWAIDTKRQGVRLTLHPEANALTAPGKTDMLFPLTARTLIAALEDGRILPSLYLSFAVLAMARGLSCAGGVFQYAYLPRMAEGTAQALRRCGDSRADRISARCPLGAGFHALRAPDSGNAASDHAAGPADILMHGGISGQDWERFGSIRARDAFLCSLAFQYEDIIPEKERLPGWLEALRHSSSLMLSHQP